MKKLSIVSMFAVLVFSFGLLYSCSKTDSDLSSHEDNSTLKRGTPTQTAQSMMIDIKGDGEYIIEGGSIVYHLDQNCVRTYFTITGPANLANSYYKCIFWEGGALSAYSQGNGKGRTTWTPKVSSVEPKTCWYIWERGEDEGESTVDVTLDITIAGESYMVSKKMSKYSFTLLNPDGTSRITDLAYSVNGSAPILLEHTVQPGDGTNNCLSDFVYDGNAGYHAGANGSSILQYLHTQNKFGFGFPPQTLGEILTTEPYDNFTNNDGICGTTAIGLASIQLEDLAPGTYSVVVSGKCKGVEGTADFNFSVNKIIHITAMGCQE